ncbi:MAG: site-specific integrase [Chloroflexi bacterium]|nr:site-specific integrase [Chloroflexota bacterium]
MVAVRWERYPLVATSDSARTWLHIQADLGLARNTVEAYGRAMQDYLQFSRAKGVDPCRANKAHIAAYVRDLTARPNPRGPTIRVLDSGAGLANATLQQRLTAVRLFHDYLMEEGVRPDNPVGRGRIRPYLKAMFVALSMGLVQLGILREPLGPDVKDGGRSGLPDPLHGVPSEWASWCERWRATSTLAPGTRKAVFHIALRAGRWLKSAHPEVTSPGQWDRPSSWPPWTGATGESGRPWNRSGQRTEASPFPPATRPSTCGR